MKFPCVASLTMVAVLLLVCPRSIADETKWFDQSDAQILNGLKTVIVSVTGVPQEVENNGLSQLQIQTDVELRLRQNGIRVVGHKEVINRGIYSVASFLNVNVNFLKDKDEGFYAYSINVELGDTIRLVRNQNVKVGNAITWQQGSVGFVGITRVKDYMRSEILRLTDQFLNDYLKANPKR